MPQPKRRRSERQFYVYILANERRTLYTGMTNNLPARVLQHKQRFVPGFTSRYGIDRLVYYEVAETAHAAIAREKQIKAWTRAKRVALIHLINPEWDDLARSWFDGADPSLRAG